MLFVELLAFWVSSRLFFNRKVLRRDDVYPALCYVINYLERIVLKLILFGTSLMVQGLRLCASSALFSAC